MPTYDYRCNDCGHEFEHLQTMTEEPLAQCPVCAGVLQRLIGSGAGLIFKGSGFYITDYKNKKSSPSGDKGHDKEKTETGGKKEASPPQSETKDKTSTKKDKEE